MREVKRRLGRFAAVRLFIEISWGSGRSVFDL